MKEIKLWNVCRCPGSSKHFLSLFPIHTFLVHASPWMLQLIIAYASKIIIKIFFLKLELRNDSLYEDLCSTTCVGILILFTFTCCMDLLTVLSHPAISTCRDLPVREITSMCQTGLGSGSLSTYYRTLSFFSK